MGVRGSVFYHGNVTCPSAIAVYYLLTYLFIYLFIYLLFIYFTYKKDTSYTAFTNMEFV